MPALSFDSRLGASVCHDDHKDRRVSGKPSYSIHDRYSNTNGDQSVLRAHPNSHADGKNRRKEQQVQVSSSCLSAINATAPNPSIYSETAQNPFDTPNPALIPRAPQRTSLKAVTTLSRLRLPVIIPQNPREGGFCRAYASLLGECQVSKTAFYYFLDDFDRSAQASPYFSAVNIASIGSLSRSNSTAMIVTFAKKRMNTFLDRVNEEFFQPRGLFCLIITWRPDINKTHQTVNIEEPIICTSIRSLPMPKTAHLEFPFGDPTENMGPTRELPTPVTMYGPIATSPAFGRGAGIPRLAGAGSYDLHNSPRYGGIGMNSGCGMVVNSQGSAMAMGAGVGFDLLGTGIGGLGMSIGRKDALERGSNFCGGPPGLTAGLDGSCLTPKAQNSSHQNGHNAVTMAQGSTRSGPDAKSFKKDAIYLMVVNLPSDEQLAPNGASY